MLVKQKFSLLCRNNPSPTHPFRSIPVKGKWNTNLQYFPMASSPMNAQTITLFNAARMGDTDTLRELIGQGADINVQDERGYTPLIIACYNGQPEAARLLLESGANVNAQDFGGNTALMGVCFKGYPDIAELLIARGADLNVQHGNGGTALMFATLFGRNQLVKVMLDHGADTTIRESRGLTALDLAVQQGNVEALDLLEARSEGLGNKGLGD